MKLLLTSMGLVTRKIQREFVKLLDKPPAENKVIVMHTARLRKHFGYLRDIRRRLVALGFKKKNICEININKKVNAKKYADFDVFYSCGGNTFHILNRVRKTGFDKVIKDFVKKNKLYVGVSAGSILVHKTIEIAGWGRDGDKNEIRLKNLNGLNITNIAIFPHFKKKHTADVNEFRRKVNYPVVAIRNGEAVVIKNKTVRVLRR